MNKTKKVAWHKHLKKAKKVRDKRRLAAQQAPKSGSSATPVAARR